MRVLIKILCAMLLLAFVGCEGCGKQETLNSFQQIIQEKDRELDSLAKVRAADSLIIQDLNKANVELKKSDSLLQIRLQRSNSKIKTIQKGYAQTDRFNSYQSSDIIRYFADSLQ